MLILMENTSLKRPVTLEYIQQQKTETLAELQNQKAVVIATAQNIFSPLSPAIKKSNSLVRAFNTGMAIFDGALIGIKMMRKIRRVFR